MGGSHSTPERLLSPRNDKYCHVDNDSRHFDSVSTDIIYGNTPEANENLARPGNRDVRCGSPR